MRKLYAPLSSLLLTLPVLSSPVWAQESAPAPAAAPAPAPEAAPATSPGAPVPPGPPPAKKGSGPALGLSPDAPGQGGAASLAPSEAVPTTEEAPTGEWRFDVTGYFRAPLRFSWGPPTTTPTGGGNAGTQFRTPPLVPDANYIDWRYTNSFVAPWTELNFHYGNDRVKSTVQIASYNLTDSGYRRLESNLGINEAFLTLTYPEFINENGRFTLLAGGFTNRYGAAGRYDAGKYETYLFGRTHIVGETGTLDYDVNDWTFEVEEGFGAKLEPIPFYGAPLGNSVSSSTPPGNPNQDLPAWQPYPGPFAQESTFVAHIHAGAVFKKELIMGGHFIDVFANDNERAGSYGPGAYGGRGVGTTAADAKPTLWIGGFDAKLIGGVLGEGYLGYSHLSATNAIYLADAIEVLHSFGGWQLHDNYFGPPGATDQVTGTIDSIEAQYSFSFGQYFHYPQAFWGDGPDLIATVFGMFNHVHSPSLNGAPLNALSHQDADGSGHINKLKFGTELLYVPLPWLGLGGRFDSVQPDLDDHTQSFSVASPRVILRTAFVTHEQVMFQYSRYFYGDAFVHGNPGGGSVFPYNSQTGGSKLGVDKNAAQVAAIIWF